MTGNRYSFTESVCQHPANVDEERLIHRILK